MNKSSEKKPSAAEAKQQLESIAGTGIEAEQLIAFRFPVGAFDYTPGSSAWRSIFFPQPGLDLHRRQPAGRERSDHHGSQRAGHVPAQQLCMPPAGPRIHCADQHSRNPSRDQAVFRDHNGYAGARPEQRVLQ